MGALLRAFFAWRSRPMRGSARGRGDAIVHSPCRPGNKAPRQSHVLAASVTVRDAVSRRCRRRGRHCGQDLERSPEIRSGTATNRRSPPSMMIKPLSIAAAAGLLIATTALGHAQSSGQRMPDSTPGQKMQDRGSVSGQPGASGYTPGHRMQEKGSRAGAPGYPAGHPAGRPRRQPRRPRRHLRHGGRPPQPRHPHRRRDGHHPP